MRAPFLRNAAILVQQFLVGRVPIAIGGDGALGTGRIAQRADDGIRAAEDIANFAQCGMDHDDVARRYAKAGQIAGEVGAGEEKGHEALTTV
jgi:hypothetical protein